MNGDMSLGGENLAPGEDESWWSAVLLEEKRWEPFSEESERESFKPQQNRMDWEQAHLLMARDEVVVMEVRGYNRGACLFKGRCCRALFHYLICCNTMSLRVKMSATG